MGDVGVQTRSRAYSSNLQQSRPIKSGGKRKQDTDDIEEEEMPSSEAESQITQGANKKENAQLPKGKSEGDSTADVGTKVQTIVKRGKKRRPAPDESDNEGENEAHTGQEATPQKSNRGTAVEIMPDKSPTSKEDSHSEGNKPERQIPRNKKRNTSGSNDNFDGSVDGSIDNESITGQDCLPYAPSFGIRMRFASIIPTPGSTFKHTTPDKDVRNRTIVSEIQPESWLDSFQTKAMLPPPPAKMPQHNAASGYIGTIDSEFLSHSSFIFPQALTRPRGRRRKYFEYLEASSAIDARWLKNPIEKLAKNVMRF